jgi:ketosteroid isomerase-like protein
MSQENVEVIRGLVDAWNHGNREGWLAPSHPDIEWSSAVLRQVEGADAAVYRGRAEIGKFWDEWHELWTLEIEASEIRDLGDTVLVLALLRTQGKSSGVEVERSIGYVFQFEDGLVRRATAYMTPEEAIEAAGLEE